MCRQCNKLIKRDVYKEKERNSQIVEKLKNYATASATFNENYFCTKK